MKNFKTKITCGTGMILLFMFAIAYLLITQTDYTKQSFYVPFLFCGGFMAGFMIWIWQLIKQNKILRDESRKLKKK